ncbi:hypothetical protein NM688_g5382 [Phlebia brevispora]|uniref:Uncharacterized protein n=1 Tax=Phlebia brevispora TaxID=194682 RepID=A0ACC1SWF9_9APHY|nr:hypothetical protein NM688_g5382 [Phlebia brevispora]
MNAEGQTSTVDLYIQAATAVWLLYEYLLMVPDEIRCVWRRRRSAATFIYLTLRYFTLLDQLHLLQYVVHWSNSPSSAQLTACTAIWRFVQSVDIIFYIAVAAFGTIRIYAITEKSMKRTALVWGLSLVFICCDLYVSFDGTIVSGSVGSSGCYRILSPNEEKEPIFGVPFSSRTDRLARVAGAACAFLAEMVIQICTWEKTWKIRCVLKRSGITEPFFYLCLRDGTVAYIAITGWFIITFALTDLTLQAMTIPFISILLCRVMLRLRQVHMTDGTKGSSPNDSIVSRVVGNLGAPLDFRSRSHEAADDDDNGDEIIFVTHDPLMAGLEQSEEMLDV